MFVEEGGKLYVETRSSRYKVARIRNNPNVQFATSTMKGQITGPSLIGIARILSPSEENIAFKALRRRFFRLRLSDTFSKLKKKSEVDDKVYLEINPEI